ncbi:hypothetical protein FKM82_015361 [Ascaphus truei]
MYSYTVAGLGKTLIPKWGLHRLLPWMASTLYWRCPNGDPINNDKPLLHLAHNALVESLLRLLNGATSIISTVWTSATVTHEQCCTENSAVPSQSLEVIGIYTRENQPQKGMKM